MSLINKMLQDLDARGTPKDGALPGQVKPVARAAFGTGRRTAAAAVGGAVAALALGALGWKMLQHGAAPVAPPAPAVAAAAPGGRSVPVTTGPAYGASAAAVPAPASAAQSAAMPAAAVTSAQPAAGAAAASTGSSAQPANASAAVAAAAPMSNAARAPQADPLAPPGAAAAPLGVPSGAAGSRTDRAGERPFARAGSRADEAADRPLTRAERRAERKRLAAERKEEKAAARRAARAGKAAAVLRTQDVAPMEPDGAEARAARRAMAQMLAGRDTSPKKRSAAMLAAARAAAHDEPASKAKPKHAAQGRQETGTQRAEGEYRRALASLQDGRMTDTIAALEGALKIDPSHEAARQTLVGVLIEMGRTDEAMRQLQLGLTLDARQPAMAMLLARLQIERGASGIETLTRTLPYAGSDPDYHAFLAAALARQQRHREAAEQYVQAVRAAPGNGVWWMGLGISLQAEKRSAEALEAFQKARATGALSPELQGFVERRIQQIGR